MSPKNPDSLTPLSELKDVKMICEGTSGPMVLRVVLSFWVGSGWAWCQERRMPEKSEVLVHPEAGQSERPET